MRRGRGIDGEERSEECMEVLIGEESESKESAEDGEESKNNERYLHKEWGFMDILDIFRVGRSFPESQGNQSEAIY